MVDAAESPERSSASANRKSCFGGSRSRHSPTEMKAPTLLGVASHRGTEISNPFPSSGESTNHRFLPHMTPSAACIAPHAQGFGDLSWIINWLCMCCHREPCDCHRVRRVVVNRQRDTVVTAKVLGLLALRGTEEVEGQAVIDVANPGCLPP